MIKNTPKSKEIEETAIESIEATIRWMEMWLPENLGKRNTISSLKESIVHIKECFIEFNKK